MEEYFQHVAKSLTIQDAGILSTLVDNDATVKFKAMLNKNLKSQTELTEATFRKIINRLEALSFIMINYDYKEHRAYITEYGVNALKSILVTIKEEEK